MKKKLTREELEEEEEDRRHAELRAEYKRKCGYTEEATQFINLFLLRLSVEELEELVSEAEPLSPGELNLIRETAKNGGEPLEKVLTPETLQRMPPEPPEGVAVEQQPEDTEESPWQSCLKFGLKGYGHQERTALDMLLSTQRGAKMAGFCR